MFAAATACVTFRTPHPSAATYSKRVKNLDLNSRSKLESSLELSARRLGDSLKRLNYPNGGKEAVFTEANLVTYFAFALMTCSPIFHCYAEAAHTLGRRIDLLAFDGEIAVAVEAKKFGNIGDGSGRLLADIKRLAEFKPLLSPLKEGAEGVGWWESAIERKGIVLIGSHAGEEVRRAWSARELADARDIVRTRKRSSRLGVESWDRENGLFLQLVEFLESQNAVRGSFEICESKWVKCENAHLLYAIFSLI